MHGSTATRRVDRVNRRHTTQDRTRISVLPRFSSLVESFRDVLF